VYIAHYFIELLRKYFEVNPQIIANFSQEDWIGFLAVFIAEIAMQRNMFATSNKTNNS
jgi:hypothetical protein